MHKLTFVVCVFIAGSVCAEEWRAPQQSAPLTFDAAAIAPVPLGAPVPLDVRFGPGGFTATNQTLSYLIQQAYGIQARELVGGPDWVRVDRFNVTATAGATVERPRAMLMLQSLLADRFQLKLARETRTGTVYSLTARSVRALNPPAKADARPLVSIIRVDGNGYLSYRYEGRNATMSMLAQRVSEHLEAPVTDETTISGSFDYVVNFTYDRAFGGLEPDPNVPTIFTALDVQLGLKLTASKGPIPVYVITQASRPSPN